MSVTLLWTKLLMARWRPAWDQLAAVEEEEEEEEEEEGMGVPLVVELSAARIIMWAPVG
jgi:hypothetical protein